MSLAYTTMASPVGPLKLVASPLGLVAVLWESDGPQRVPLEEVLRADHDSVLLETERQLLEYFDGARRTFSIPLDMRGTSFQKQVWTALQQISFGATTSYAGLAEALGTPLATRAVGAANGRNPLSVIVPCHRVVGANGRLTGFAGGLNAKALLLQLEQQHSFQLS